MSSPKRKQGPLGEALKIKARASTQQLVAPSADKVVVLPSRTQRTGNNIIKAQKIVPPGQWQLTDKVLPGVLCPSDRANPPAFRNLMRTLPAFCTLIDQSYRRMLCNSTIRSGPTSRFRGPTTTMSTCISALRGDSPCRIFSFPFQPNCSVFAQLC